MKDHLGYPFHVLKWIYPLMEHTVEQWLIQRGNIVLWRGFWSFRVTGKEEGNFSTMRQGGILVYKMHFDLFNKGHRMLLKWDKELMNDRLKLIKTEFPTSKWVTLGTTKAELCKQIWKETYMGQLKWARSQAKKMTKSEIASLHQSNNKKIKKKWGPIFQNR